MERGKEREEGAKERCRVRARKRVVRYRWRDGDFERKCGKEDDSMSETETAKQDFERGRERASVRRRATNYTRGEKRVRARVKIRKEG